MVFNFERVDEFKGIGFFARRGEDEEGEEAFVQRSGLDLLLMLSKAKILSAIELLHPLIASSLIGFCSMKEGIPFGFLNPKVPLVVSTLSGVLTTTLGMLGDTEVAACVSFFFLYFENGGVFGLYDIDSRSKNGFCLMEDTNVCAFVMEAETFILDFDSNSAFFHAMLPLELGSIPFSFAVAVVVVVVVAAAAVVLDVLSLLILV